LPVEDEGERREEPRVSATGIHTHQVRILPLIQGTKSVSLPFKESIFYKEESA